MILTKEFLIAQGGCQEGIDIAEKDGYFGMEYDDVIADLLRRGEQQHASGLLLYKTTELYVRMNGSQFTMGAYQVFNPLTGVHTRYETEAEARQALIQIAEEILSAHRPTVVQELSNEHGDTTWIPVEMYKTLVVS